MPDEIDAANDYEAGCRERTISEIRTAAASIPAGSAGDCDLCGEWSGRLVDGACAPCRDRYADAERRNHGL